jgi:4-hydroxy-tetrahydrodipicolinate reductase
MRIVLNGALGRMGRMVTEAAAAAGDEVVALLDNPGHPEAGRDVVTPWGPRPLLSDPTAITAAADVGIDFSAPAATVAFVAAMASKGVPVLCGTTGLSDAQIEELKAASREAPVLLAANTSIGVFALHEVAALARSILGPAYDVEIVEVHHRHKRDAPSGTALSLARRLGGETDAGRRGLEAPPYRVRAGRDGDCGPRPADEIGVLAVRGGEVVGDHTVHFLGPHDRLELTHRVMSRSALAEGALALARRLSGKAPGWYRRPDDLFRAPA